MQKLLIKIRILLSTKKKILSIFSNCDEGKIMILNPKKKKKKKKMKRAYIYIYIYMCACIIEYLINRELYGQLHR